MYIAIVRGSPIICPFPVAFLGRCFMSFYSKLHALMRLKYFDYLDNVVGPWVTARAEHTVYALVRLLKLLGQLLKRDCCVYIIPKHGLAGLEIACEQFVNRLGQHLSAECRIGFCTQ